MIIISTGELGYDGPLYDEFLHMTDDMRGPSPMYIKYSSYVYDRFCIQPIFLVPLSRHVQVHLYNKISICTYCIPCSHCGSLINEYFMPGSWPGFRDWVRLDSTWPTQVVRRGKLDPRSDSPARISGYATNLLICRGC